MAKESESQKDTIHRVMHEYKHGELQSGVGGTVKNPRQAVAIALSEAGASVKKSPQRNEATLRKTKAKERAGETAQAKTEGKGAQDRLLRGGKSRPKAKAKR